MAMNCWEFKNCGREFGGEKAHELGVCPASIEQRLDGCNNGKNAGRACWIITGTLCEGEQQGTFGSKMGTCMACEFFKLVVSEEAEHLVKTKDLLVKIQ